jgi:hypothetical protein
MFKNIALPKGYGITRESLKSLYDHSFDGDIDFAALSVISDILSKGIILSHWADAHTIVDKTSVIAAPIEINNERHYAVLISGKKKSEFKYPYVMRVFSDAYIKDELLNIYRTSPQGVTTSRQNADFQKFAANLLINYILNNSDLSFLTTNSANTQNNDNNQQQINCNRNMNKKLIRLTEQDLHKIVKESINRILKEDDSTPNIYNNRSMFAKFMYQTMSKMHDINETLFYNVLNGRINQFKILSNEEKDRLVEIAEMANKLNGNIAYLSEMLESQSSSQFEHEPEDWYERNEHGDFDTY